MKKFIYLVLITLIFASCGANESEPTEVDPANSDELARALTIVGSNQVNGTAPSPSNDASAPDVNGNQGSARITNGNNLVLPFSYTSNTSNGYGGCYVQVQGASFYWDIPGGSSNPQSGQVQLPIGIPSNVLDGTFTLLYCIYDANGLVSNVLSTQVTIAPPKSCPGFESGNDGLTIFEYDLGTTAGEVTINYDTFSIPDRIDIEYNGTFVDGTGSLLGSGQFPPQLNCSNASSSDGFVGTSGTFTLNHTPGNGNTLKVYVSGCIGGGTAWNIDVSCPQ